LACGQDSSRPPQKTIRRTIRSRQSQVVVDSTPTTTGKSRLTQESRRKTETQTGPPRHPLSYPLCRTPPTQKRSIKTRMLQKGNMTTRKLYLVIMAAGLAGAMSAGAVTLTFSGVNPNEIMTLQVSSPSFSGGVYAGVYNPTVDGVATPPSALMYPARFTPVKLTTTTLTPTFPLLRWLPPVPWAWLPQPISRNYGRRTTLPP
jgi:hypothetical protein